jgi:hypothetical protein
MTEEILNDNPELILKDLKPQNIDDLVERRKEMNNNFESWRLKAIEDKSIKECHRNSLKNCSSQELELWEIIFDGGSDSEKIESKP